ncbi:MAG TPA: protein kinase [Pyrinomonadaceae bacterium]|nr:protein kinase [Pyrinomonadaceae bacterium]
MSVKCASCAEEIPEDRVTCPTCGTAVGDSFTPTRLFTEVPDSAPRREVSSGRKVSSGSPRGGVSFDSIDNARFVAGTILAERYRIVGMLGRGGMGEVYRADDLKLGQPVALKFLPEKLSNDGGALARFHREVRVARQVSHRNVCRVYDIGEIDGQQFLSMEFIKGEELSSLLRRIGRLPTDKATQIARQLCAGLAAAHEGGVLHRDLKPANVMIDADGNVRVLDFGLAGLSEDLRQEDLRAGTPAYMSPEQLAGEELTLKSDIYSLGLLLYEVFTGKKAFEAGSLPELLEIRRSGATPTNPSELVQELDPLIERVILRCLAQEPEKRPASALQVAASLPGGDPLAAALAAGETPSPEMVAAAPMEGVLKPSMAVTLVASVLLGLGLMMFLSSRISMYRNVPLEKSSAVLEDRARSIIRKAGDASQPMDSASDFGVDEAYLTHAGEHDADPSTRWNSLRRGQPAVIYFWYRQSPRYLMPYNREMLTVDDPPQVVTGMSGVSLDTLGRLISFYQIPPQRDAAQGNAQTTEASTASAIAGPASAEAAPDWSMFFAEAGLNFADFHAADSTWVPMSAYDARVAWDGAYAEQPAMKVHVEAASFHGQPVYFQLINPWDRPVREWPFQLSASSRALVVLLITVFMVVLIGSIVLAARSSRLGRGDRKGASRLALVVFVVGMLIWVFTSHHVPVAEEFESFITGIQSSVFVACFFWLIYMALEPLVRRRWPTRIISWSRLLAGGWRDPLVGRDILIGALFGVLTILHIYVSYWILRWLGGARFKPMVNPSSQLLGLNHFPQSFFSQLGQSLEVSFFYLFLLLLLSIVLRTNKLAALAAWLIYTCALALLIAAVGPIGWLLAAMSAGLQVIVLHRYGLLSMLCAQFFYHIFIFYPVTSELSAWYAGSFVLILIISLALVLYAFYVSLGNQKLFRGGLLQD